MNKTVKLNNGVEMPILGYGVYSNSPRRNVNVAYWMLSA